MDKKDELINELLEALKTAETYFAEYAPETPASVHTLIHIRRAIAKAEGGTIACDNCGCDDGKVTVRKNGQHECRLCAEAEGA